MDCFGDSAVTGKSSNDLAERKCTWVTCKLLEKLGAYSSPEPQVTLSPEIQRFNDHFGKAEKEHIDVAMKIITENGIKEEFRNFQEQLVNELRDDIERLVFLKTFFINVIRSIGKRKME